MRGVWGRVLQSCQAPPPPVLFWWQSGLPRLQAHTGPV